MLLVACCRLRLFIHPNRERPDAAAAAAAAASASTSAAAAAAARSFARRSSLLSFRRLFSSLLRSPISSYSAISSGLFSRGSLSMYDATGASHESSRRIALIASRWPLTAAVQIACQGVSLGVKGCGVRCAGVFVFMLGLVLELELELGLALSASSCCTLWPAQSVASVSAPARPSTSMTSTWFLRAAR